ncbi:putative serine/threonine-protein kinase [Wickerhamomyces ciferrii]|uniref:Serine/threonine-protein kinase n=1 Tax=Wickerhamomyces ciferrii (strain ATCC 14091 / BCRC 22168 / CBS 111 / JCM 3599 / NBRC 0793 / NRRL Y-1031 F-60-10) TaxID=1206466 RepID=K0KTD3_WICCF|nr:putative serine/threonine-protein kinase [Wickerhamomyces ciferrii]CCH46426.1 putative serine/threonine-protein kinase [Wickerhamomyces ciferrii]
MNSTASQSNLKQFFGKLRSSSKSRQNSNSPENGGTPSISRTSSSTKLGGNIGSGFGKQLKTLGSGISSKVDLYYKKSTNEYFAVKTFRGRENYESRDEYRKRCYHEYDITRDLNHENITKTFSFISSISSSNHQLVMEFTPYSLLKIIQVATPGEQEILCFFRQIVSGLNYLHDNYIAHRDLKLENIQMDSHGIVKIIDFGTAFKFGPTPRKLAIGAVGTEALISPEALSKLQYDGELSDIWSLGILLYSMINVDFPWTAARESNSEFKSFKQDPQVLIKSNYPEQVWNLIGQILQLEPTSRIKTNEILTQLGSLTPDSVPPHIQCPSKKHAKTLKICANRFKL